MKKRVVLIVALLGLSVAAAAQKIRHEGNEEEFQTGKVVTTTIHVGDLALSVHFDKAGHLQAGDMPQVARARDIDGRDLAIVTAGGNPVAEFQFRPHGNVERVELANGLKYSVVKQGKKKYKETLFGPNGKILSERVISPDRRVAPAAVTLDPIARQLGFSLDSVAIEMTADRLMTVKRRSDGAALLYVVTVGGDQVGFDTTGRTLFYDMSADIHGGGDAETAADEFAFLPDRIVLTRDGQIGAAVWSPAPDGIMSFWTERLPNGEVSTSVRTGAASNSTPPAATSTSRRSLRPGALAGEGTMCVVTDIQTCYPADLGGGCVDDISWSCYGGSPYPPAPAPGGGGGGSASNHVTTSAAARAAVTNGISSASSKMQNQQCFNLLNTLTNSNGRTLAQELTNRGATSVADYLNNRVGFYDGTNKVDPQNGTIPCNNGWEAWVDPVYSPLIYICSPFVTAAPQPGMQGVYTIHEMLHTLGFPEGAPPLMSSSQITNMIIQACGQ